MVNKAIELPVFGTITDFQNPNLYADNYSLSFDGVDERVRIPHDSTLSFERTDEFSIGLWINTIGTSTYSLYGKMQAAGQPGFLLIMLPSGKIRPNFLGSTGTLNADTTGTVNDGDWHHVCVTYDGSSDVSGLKVYIDGVSETLSTVTNTLAGTMVNTQDIYLGTRTSIDILFYGNMNNVSVWDKELSSLEVAEMYNSGVCINLKSHTAVNNLVSWWPFDDPSSHPTITDYNNGNPGIAENMDSTNYETDVPA